ncbi:MAG: sulfotransferase family protein [Planctomycetaceae bacterium]|nr:sulfotransferase family protein [Planctomycetaceae bacterium]
MVKFVGRFERLQKDFTQVTKALGIPEIALPKTNWTNHSHYRDYFDSETRELAEALYRRDLDTFGYQFEEAVKD